MQTSFRSSRVAFIGCGYMGSAILDGLLKSDSIDPSLTHITTVEPELESLRTRFPSIQHVSSDNKKAIEDADLIFLCVKPKVVDSILKIIDALASVKGKIMITIVAGRSISEYHAVGTTIHNLSIIRCMPNVAVQVGAGILSLYTKDQVDREGITDLLKPLGCTFFVNDEAEIDSITALTGSGPAFIATVIEALADGALKQGIPKKQALNLATHMVLGTAKMMIANGTDGSVQHPALLRDSVMTPGGCTIAGMEALEQGGLRASLMAAINEATKSLRKL